jgi:hypothetical protein
VIRHGSSKLNAEMSAANEKLFGLRYAHIQADATRASRKARRAHVRSLGGIRAAIRANHAPAAEVAAYERDL